MDRTMTTSSCPRWASRSPRAPSSAGSRRSATTSTATSRSSRSRPTRWTRRFRPPAAGVLTEIKVKEGETVPVNSVVAVIGARERLSRAAPADAPPTDALPEAAVGQPEAAGRPPRPLSSARRGNRPEGQFEAGLKATEAEATPAAPETEADAEPDPTSGKKMLRRQKSSPLVRRIAREHNVDIAQINGTGISGRVTKKRHPRLHRDRSRRPRRRRRVPRARRHRRRSGHIPAYKPGDKVEIVPMTIMRKKIAEHMVLSAHTSPHVYSVYEVDFPRVRSCATRRRRSTSAPARS